MDAPSRHFKLKVWGLALGYFCFYAPYSALIKVVTGGLWPGAEGGASGFRLLPAVALSTALALPLIVTARGWWGYLGRRSFGGRSVPAPAPLVWLSGLGTAVIILTTTLAFTFEGVSIVFALLLMRGGVLVMAPAVDFAFGRRVRWFSAVALLLALAAVGLALADVNNYHLTTVPAVCIAAYLAGYLLRLPCVTRLAKSEDVAATRRYFVEEQLIAAPLLLLLPAALALAGAGEISAELRRGFGEFFVSGLTAPALLVGALYACLYYFGTLIYLDCRENTFCVPLNRGASLLAGLCASGALALFLGQRPPSAAQLAGAGFILTALLLLSPLHHPRRQAAKLRRALEAAGRARLGFIPGRRAPGEHLATEGRLMRRDFLFVCSGNTCRSPMAAEIGNAEIARRLRSPTAEAAVWAGVRAQSAGVTARAGAPMTDEARAALAALGIDARPHAASNLTEELAQEVERIYCMTRAQREAVISLVPAAADKTHCLDPEGDVDDPHGSGPAAYLECARRIRALVCLRFDELSLSMAE